MVWRFTPFLEFNRSRWGGAWPALLRRLRTALNGRNRTRATFILRRLAWVGTLRSGGGWVGRWVGMVCVCVCACVRACARARVRARAWRAGEGGGKVAAAAAGKAESISGRVMPSWCPALRGLRASAKRGACVDLGGCGFSRPCSRGQHQAWFLRLATGAPAPKWSANAERVAPQGRMASGPQPYAFENASSANCAERH